MTDQPTLKVFFSEDPSKPVAQGCDLTEALAAVTAGGAVLPPGAAQGLEKAFGSALEEVFQVKVCDLLASSWGKVASLREAMRDTAKDPDSVVFVPLMDHKLTSNHTPHVDVTWGGKSLAQIAFDIALTLQLKGVELEIRKGRLHGLRGGGCQGEGQFSFGGKPLIKRQTPEFSLAGLSLAACEVEPEPDVERDAEAKPAA